jgi:hypothetical protein
LPTRRGEHRFFTGSFARRSSLACGGFAERELRAMLEREVREEE